MEEIQEIKGYLNVEGLLTQFPSKRRKQFIAIYMLFEKLDPNTVYNERQLNEELKKYHTFGDPALFRRDMVDLGLLERDVAGREYRINPQHLTLQQLFEKWL